MSRRVAHGWWIGHVLLAMSFTGCAKKADMTAAPEAHADAGGESVAADDIAALEQQLATREGQLRSAGVAVPVQQQHLKKAGAAENVEEAPATAPAEPATPAPTTAPSAAGADATYDLQPETQGGRCMQVCEISTAICSLQDQICGLVPRHRDDPRYQSACERAAADCRISTEACHGCSDS